MIPTSTKLNDLTNHQVSLTITQHYSDRFGSVRSVASVRTFQLYLSLNTCTCDTSSLSHSQALSNLKQKNIFKRKTFKTI